MGFQQGDFGGYMVAFPNQEISHGTPETGIGDPVGGMGGDR